MNTNVQVSFKVINPVVILKTRNVRSYWDGNEFVTFQRRIAKQLTIPGIKHVIDEEVYKTGLWFWYTAGFSIKCRHNHR